MNDPIEQVEQTIKADAEAAAVKARAEETRLAGSVKTHIAFFIGIGCFIVGAVLGYFAK